MESMPFTGTDEIHMSAPTCKYADSKSGFNDMVGIEIRYRQGNLAVFFIEVTEGAEVVSRSGMEMNVRSPILSYRHPEIPSVVEGSLRPGGVLHV